MVSSAAFFWKIGMSRSVFFIECSATHWFEVAKRIEAASIKVSKWTAWIHAKPHIDAAVFHDTIHAKRALDKDGQKPRSLLFDDACEKVWREDAQTVYDMMNRFDPIRDQSFLERSNLFVDHLCQWRGEIERHKPDLVVFPAPPHAVYDYVLLAICRAMSVPTLMFEEVTIMPPYSLAMSDYMAGPKVNLAEKHGISDETRQISAKLRGAYREARPWREVVAEQQKNDTLKDGRAALSRLLEVTRANDAENEGSYDTAERIANVTSLTKQRGVSLRESFAGDYANTSYVRQLLTSVEEIEAMRAVYEASLIYQLPPKFVYVPLAGQPERTSSPQADIHANQLLMIRYIAAALPIGCGIVIKEHPNQFSPHFGGGTSRDFEFYQTLQDLGCLFASTSLDPFILIDKADVIATTGGTAALEAAARGKNTLLFGDAWFRSCPGMTRVRTQADVKRFFASPPKPPTREDFENYLEQIKAASFEGMADYPPDDYPMDPQKNLDNLTRLILEAIKRHADDLNELR